MWGITVYFNPQQYSQQYSRFKAFSEGVRKQGLPLIVVELSFNNSFEIRDDDVEKIVRIKGGRNNVMWQKEALLHVAYQNLPEACPKFAWLDCDIIFGNNNWVEETSKLLDKHQVVQPFSHCIRLRRNQTISSLTENRKSQSRVRPSVPYSYLINPDDPWERGFTGFAWAARKSVFEDVEIYRKMIFGGGDTIIASSFYGKTNFKYSEKVNRQLRNDQLKWIRTIHERVRGNVGFTKGMVFHLWHGTPKRRYTAERLALLTEKNFDLNHDIALNEDGIWEWKSNEQLQRIINQYFWKRNEEGSMLKELILTIHEATCEHILNPVTSSVKSVLDVYFYTLPRDFFKKHKYRIQTLLMRLMSLHRRRKKFDEKLSLVILNWKRPELLKKIIETYDSYSFINEIVIWNNDAQELVSIDTQKEVRIINCKFDAGLDSRFAAASLAKNDAILIHDDDLLLPEICLEFLFHKYLEDPMIIHGLSGRNNKQGTYFMKTVYGEVDIVLTICMIINKKYIAEYFKVIPLFDQLRIYGCGNGEDIIMNYLVRKITQRKNRAYNLPRQNFNILAHVYEHAIHNRPLHQEVRNELVRLCEELFLNNTPRTANPELLEIIGYSPDN
jgi:hypothetical protein